jgi:hypothetical protein
VANPNNVPLKKFRKFLIKEEGCTHIRDSGGHEIYARNDLPRSFPIQSHIDPVPRFIVDNARRWLGYLTPDQKKEFYRKLSKL